MTKGQAILAELEAEMPATTQMLKNVPMEKADWKPHEKSMTLGRLALHIAEIHGWGKECIEDDVLDFSKMDSEPNIVNSNQELISLLDKGMERTRDLLKNKSDEEIVMPWTMRDGEQIFYTIPKEEVVRTWMLKHIIHHRAQLGVFLRLLDVPIPGSYGPSADTM